ncbi:MAG: efflux RND transporter periplasmic adaptor subunit [Sulfurospirillaceae bacterium]|nr:efflux RND transporter periplasmic adaptor subunit [Sulfurospirillaceae bacterium]MDD2826755.1 efflux RND transporter periplasmic adaptor subunit [Sulfurospirillaceae bacterium]
MRTPKLTLSLCALTLLLLPSLAFSADEAKATPPKMPAPKADAYIVPSAQSLPIMLKYPAEIKSQQNVKVVARVTGVLQEKYFTEGQNVKAGDLLYKIEDTIYKAKVDAANASVKMNDATLANATRNWERTKTLYANKAISQEKRDAALAAFDEATAALSLAKAQLHQAQIDLDYTKVKAPISGTTGMKKVDIGDFVSAASATSLVEITQNAKVFVEFSMPLSDYTNIKSKLWALPENGKLHAAIEVDNKPTTKVGIVDFMDANVNKDTGTVKMRAIVENADSVLLPGSFVRVVLNDIVQKNVITIPQKAVLQNPLGKIVFIEANGHVGVKPVVLGNETGDKYIVMGGPLQSGDKVIINNFFRLKPGGEVLIDKTINEQGK